MNKSIPLGLIPRDMWLRERVLNCIDALNRYAEQDNWELFKHHSKRFAEELNYAVTEWDKYYPDE